MPENQLPLEQNKSAERHFAKSLGAIAAGFFAVLVLTVVSDMVLEKLGAFPPSTNPEAYTWKMLFVALIYRSAYGVAGGYITAAAAPSRPMRHAVILGLLGAVFALLGSIANWDKTSPANVWYPILLILFTLPSVCLGGKIKTSTGA